MAADMECVFCRPDSLYDNMYTYCAGCGHGTSQRLVAEVIQELGLRENAIGVVGIGCYGNARYNWNFDVQYTLHGRAAATATGVKRCLPNNLVFTFQGDGDCAAIGTAETIHAAYRGEKITQIMLNNANYGETGGQMAPTTIIGQKTMSTPTGRRTDWNGFPLDMSQLVSLSPGAAYVATVSLHNPQHVNRAKRALRRAFEIQMQGLGYSMIQIISPCPTSWRMKPIESLQFIEKEMLKTYTIGEQKVPAEEITRAA